MNLHSVRFALVNVAIWLVLTGRNGRGIGNHLWVVEEGTPPDTQETRPTWNRYNWVPNRFAWRPFGYHNLHGRRGADYVAPLCGRLSQSTSPRMSEGYGPACEICRRAAVTRGIIPLTYTEAVQQSTIRLALDAERMEWENAGRPDTWPLSPSP